MATKEHRRRARDLITTLESRVHLGPPISAAEINSAREFLRQNDFSTTSDYYNRLGQVQHRLVTRPTAPACLPAGKRNYGGEAAGSWLQVQSAFDHVIVSTCYQGEFNSQRGRIKISHRFNQAGRIDFVELKFLRSLQPVLNGELRKLVRICDYPGIRKDWLTAEAFILPVLPRELIFLYEEIFRCPRPEVIAWLVNIGHRLVKDVQQDLASRAGATDAAEANENGQLPLAAVLGDDVAAPIFQHVAAFECAAEITGAQTAEIRYLRK